MLCYTDDAGVPWRCDRADRISAIIPEFEPAPDKLAKLHALLLPHAQLFTVARRIWGLVPVIPSADEPEDNLRTWGELELCNAIGVDRAGFSTIWESIRGLWLSNCRSTPAVVVEAPAAPAREELDLEGDQIQALLKEQGFLAIKFESTDEKEWFTKRLAELRKLLEISGTRGLGRQLLLTELEQRRADAAVFSSTLSDKEIKERRAWRDQVRDTYLELTAQLDNVASWFFNVGGVNFKNCLSEVIAGHQAFQQSGDAAMLDGIFTATEIQVLHRMSTQSSDPNKSPAPIQYRAGLVAYLQAAKVGVLQSGWKSGIPHSMLAKMDRAYAAAFAEAAKSSDDPIPDLLKTGEVGEYPKIQDAQEKAEA